MRCGMTKQHTEKATRRLRFRTMAVPVFAWARPENWFVSKIPPLLAIAYLCLLRPGRTTTGMAAAGLLGCGLLSILCVAVYGHVVNDVFDKEADRLAGKVNRLAAMPPVVCALLAAALLVAGFLPGVTAGYSAGAFVLLALNYLWPTIYSAPLTRLKERGLWGVGCDALGSHITPTLFMLALLRGNESPELALLATLWAAALGLKGILHHQIADRENDMQSGIVTFATLSHMQALQRFLARFNLLVELPVSAVFAGAISGWCPLAGIALLVYVAGETLKYKLGFQFALTADPQTIRPSVPFANEMYYVLWLPMTAGIQLGMSQQALLALPVLHALIFQQAITAQIADWRAIVQNTAHIYRAHRRSS